MALKVLWHFRLKLLPWNKDCHPSRLESHSDGAPASLLWSVSLFLCGVSCTGSWRQCYADRVQATERTPHNSRIMRRPWWVLPRYRAIEISLTAHGVNCLVRVPGESGQHPAAVTRLTPEFSNSQRKLFLPAGLYLFSLHRSTMSTIFYQSSQLNESYFLAS